jgi:hypothetical protein
MVAKSLKMVFNSTKMQTSIQTDRQKNKQSTCSETMVAKSLKMVFSSAIDWTIFWISRSRFLTSTVLSSWSRFEESVWAGIDGQF